MLHKYKCVWWSGAPWGGWVRGRGHETPVCRSLKEWIPLGSKAWWLKGAGIPGAERCCVYLMSTYPPSGEWEVHSMEKRRLCSREEHCPWEQPWGSPLRAGFENCRWRKVIRTNTRCLVTFEFQINYKYFFFLHGIHTKRLLVYLRLKCNWAFYILFAQSGNPK